MEKAKFEEAKKQYDIIAACDKALETRDKYNIYNCDGSEAELRDSFMNIIFIDTNVTRSFVRWVENEKAIAEQKLKEI